MCSNSDLINTMDDFLEIRLLQMNIFNRSECAHPIQHLHSRCFSAVAGHGNKLLVAVGNPERQGGRKKIKGGCDRILEFDFHHGRQSDPLAQRFQVAS